MAAPNAFRTICQLFPLIPGAAWRKGLGALRNSFSQTFFAFWGDTWGEPKEGAPRMGREAKFRKDLSMPGMLAEMRRCFERVEDPVASRGVTLADCLMSGLAVFALKYPSLLQFERDARGLGEASDGLRRHGSPLNVRLSRPISCPSLEGWRKPAFLSMGAS